MTEDVAVMQGFDFDLSFLDDFVVQQMNSGKPTYQ